MSVLSCPADKSEDKSAVRVRVRSPAASGEDGAANGERVDDGVVGGGNLGHLGAGRLGLGLG